MSLPNDVSRCSGVGSDKEGWREGCETCQRRQHSTLGHGALYTWMEPPAIIAFECEWLIEPDECP